MLLDQEVKKQEQPKGKKIVLFLLIVSIILFLVGLIIFIVLSRKGKFEDLYNEGENKPIMF